MNDPHFVYREGGEMVSERFNSLFDAEAEVRRLQKIKGGVGATFHILRSLGEWKPKQKEIIEVGDVVGCYAKSQHPHYSHSILDIKEHPNGHKYTPIWDGDGWRNKRIDDLTLIHKGPTTRTFEGVRIVKDHGFTVTVNADHSQLHPEGYWQMAGNGKTYIMTLTEESK